MGVCVRMCFDVIAWLCAYQDVRLSNVSIWLMVSKQECKVIKHVADGVVGKEEGAW